MHGSEQLSESLLRTEGPDRRTLEVPSVPGDDLLGAARACCSYLHGIFEVGHGEPSGVPDRGSSGFGDFDEPREFDDEVTRAGSVERRPYQVVEVGDGMPRDERAGAAVFQPVDEFGGRAGVGASVEREIDEYVGVDQDQRYFSARAA